MSAGFKLLLLLIADAATILTCQTTTILLLNQWYQNSLTPYLTTTVFISLSWLSGFYRTSISHLGISVVMLALGASLLSGLIAFMLEGSRAFALFSSALTLIGVIGYRVVTRELLFKQRHSGAASSLVYGAGSAGVQFVTASMQGDAHNVVGYIDDDPAMKGKSIHGRNVYASKNIEALVKKYSVTIIVLALPSS